MTGVRGLVNLSLMAFGIIALGGFSLAVLSSRGQHVLDSHVLVATEDLRRVQQGDMVLTQRGGAARLERGLQVAEGARRMIHAGSSAFLVCGLMAVAGGVCQVILLRRLRRADESHRAT